jgi:hypothetical protein
VKAALGVPDTSSLRPDWTLYGPRIAGIANDLAMLRRMMQGSSIVAQASAAANQTTMKFFVASDVDFLG